jgi:flagellar M-ring protein FliF
MSMLQFTKDDIMRGIELLVMALLGIVVLLFVVRPLVRRIVTPEQLQALTSGAAAAITGGNPGGAGAAGTAATAVLAENGDIGAIPASQTAQMIDIAQVQGQVHAQSLHKVGELAQKNPQETISIIRQWLHESAA